MASLFSVFHALVIAMGLASPSPRVADLLNRWAASRTADGRQPRGVLRYRQQLEAFVRWAGEDLTVSEIDRNLVRKYKTAIGSRPATRKRRSESDGLIAPGTTRNALTALRAFCAWCVEEGLLDSNPAQEVSHPKVMPPPPDALTRTDLARLLRVIDAQPTQAHQRAVWQRNRLCILLMLYTGLRRAEIADLRWGDFDLLRRELIVRCGKGGKSRMVPLTAELLHELRQAFRHDPNALVLGLSHKLVGKVFEVWLPRRWNRVEGVVAPSVSPHRLRRTFATELYVRGAELLTIQRLMGHSDPKTTLRYIMASSSKEHDAVALLAFRPDAVEPTTDEVEATSRLHFRAA